MNDRCFRHAESYPCYLCQQEEDGHKEPRLEVKQLVDIRFADPVKQEELEKRRESYYGYKRVWY